MSYPYFSALQKSLEGKKVLIFGLGKQGGGTRVANTILKCRAQVRVTDMKSEEELADSLQELDPAISRTLGEHTSQDILWADLIIKNPAVAFSHELMQLAEENNIPVTTETALALEFIRDATIGITGTRGKTTTTYLLHHILTSNGLPAVIGGNIPQQPTLALLETAPEDTLFVIEISSFHIEAMDRNHLSPRYAVLTNIYPDHLNRYSSLEEYAAVKAALFRWQKSGDHAFWSPNPEWENTVTPAIQNAAAFHPVSDTTIRETLLLGKHNQENIALAVLVARTFHLSDRDILNAVKTFPGVPHRLETIATLGDISCINDTTSTTPTALEKALDAVTQPHVLIVGGATKHLPFSPHLLEKLRAKADTTVWLKGSGTTELLAALHSEAFPPLAESLEEAVRRAYHLAQAKHLKTILFSPGFTSFEMFDNEFHRGENFRSIVQKLQAHS